MAFFTGGCATSTSGGIKIIRWIFVGKYLKREINKLLYEKTELFEGKTHLDFKEDLHNFFAKKICRFQKEENELLKILEQYQLIDDFAKIKNEYLFQF